MRVPNRSNMQNNNNNKTNNNNSSNNSDSRKSDPEPVSRRDDDGDRDDRKEQRRDSDDDDGDRDDRRDGRRDVGIAGDDGNAAAPATVVDLIKRIFSNPAKPHARAAAGGLGRRGSLLGHKAGGRPQPLPAKPLDRAKRGSARAARPVGDLRLRLPTLDSRDILARNASSSVLQKAVSLGMQVTSTQSFGILDYSVTRLLLPPSMDASQARAMLRELVPDAALDLNRRYRLHPSARTQSGARSTEPARSTGGCGSDRCYGSDTIGWSGRLASCAANVRIGVIDTGIDSTHPALDGQTQRINQGTIGRERRGASADLHGTGVLALLAGDTHSTTPGLVPRAKFYVADIFFADENGAPVSTTLHLLEALELMDRLQVQIINLSLSGPRDPLVEAAIARMSRPRSESGVRRPGTIFVAAAGNGGPGAPPSYPAAYSQVLAVTAVGKDLRGYRRANQGNYIDVAAPGVNIWTALPNGSQGFQSGTSFATPYVTAIVASMYRSLPYHRSKNAILQRISTLDLGAPGRDRIYGRGLVQAPAGCGTSSPWSPTIVSTRRRGQLAASR